MNKESAYPTNGGSKQKIGSDPLEVISECDPGKRKQNHRQKRKRYIKKRYVTLGDIVALCGFSFLIGVSCAGLALAIHSLITAG